MEPENNVQNNVPEKPAVEAPKENIVFNDKPKKNTGMIFGMILLLILAIGGVGFGVWAWMDGNTRVEDLNKRIEALNTQDNELLDKIKEFENYEEGIDEDAEIDVKEDVSTDVDADVDTDIDVSKNTDINMDVNINTADYIYVGRWGLKIKIIDNLKGVEYASFYGNDFSRLCVAGLTNRAGYSYKFGSLYENLPGLACVIRGPSNYTSKDCSSMFSIDDHNYCVLSNNLSKYSRTEEEIELEKESMRLVVEMLSNPSNYSKI